MNPRSDVSIASVYDPHYGLQLLLLLGFLIPAVLFLLTQHNTLRRVRRENRLMQPGLVWLQLIPVFGNIWQFFVIYRISGSIHKEFASWHEDTFFGPDAVIVQGTVPARPARGIGIAYAVLDTVVILLSLAMDFVIGRPNDDLLLGMIAWATIICWIIYWVRLVQYKNKLKRVLA